MSKSNEERDIYYIPPNFLASGRLFGGMIRARNAIEACVLVLLTGILNVAKTKIILNLENDEAQRVQHILHLSDAEIMSITRFERGQGLISTNSNHITVSFKASPLEKQLITTDRMELNQILKEKIAQNTHNVVE